MGGNKVFEDAVKLKGSHLGLGCAPNLVTGVLPRRPWEGTDTQGRRPCDNRQGDTASSQGTGGLLAATGGWKSQEEFFPRLHRELGPASTLISVL